mgnify:CR=1 FL=1
MVNSKGYTGRKSGIGTTAVQITSQSIKAGVGMTIYADTGNSGTLYVGFSENITADNSDNTDGFPVAAGAALDINIRNIERVYIIASTGSANKVWWIVN